MKFKIIIFTLLGYLSTQTSFAGNPSEIDDTNDEGVMRFPRETFIDARRIRDLDGPMKKARKDRESPNPDIRRAALQKEEHLKAAGLKILNEGGLWKDVSLIMRSPKHKEARSRLNPNFNFADSRAHAKSILAELANMADCIDRRYYLYSKGLIDYRLVEEKHFITARRIRNIWRELPKVKEENQSPHSHIREAALQKEKQQIWDEEFVENVRALIRAEASQKRRTLSLEDQQKDGPWALQIINTLANHADTLGLPDPQSEQFLLLNFFQTQINLSAPHENLEQIKILPLPLRER